MTLTIDPAAEACQALVARISGGTYSQSIGDVSYSDQLSDRLESLKYPAVDLIPEDEETLDETLATEDRTSHSIRVWIRSPAISQQQVDDLKLFVREVYRQLNDFDSTNGRVRVWECSLEQKANPDKDALRNESLFRTSILLRVEVEPA